MADLPAAKRVSSTSPIPRWFTGANPGHPLYTARVRDDARHIFHHIVLDGGSDMIPMIRYPASCRISRVEIDCYKIDYYNTERRQYTIKIDRNHLRLVQALIPKRARELLDEYDSIHGTSTVLIPIPETGSRDPEDWRSTILVHFEGVSPATVSMNMYSVGRKVYVPVGTDRHRASRPVNIIWDETMSKFVPPPDCDQLGFALRNHRL